MVDVRVGNQLGIRVLKEYERANDSKEMVSFEANTMKASMDVIKCNGVSE